MNLQSWFKDKITVQSVTGVSSSGQPVYGAKRIVKCRVEHDMKKITDSAGQEKVSDAQIALSEKLSSLDRIWLPGTDTTKIQDARTSQNYKEATSKDGRTTIMMLYL